MLTRTPWLLLPLPVGVEFLRQKLAELPTAKGAAPNFLEENVLHHLLFVLRTNSEFSKEKASVLKALQAVYPDSQVSLSLRPLLTTFSAPCNSNR